MWCVEYRPYFTVIKHLKFLDFVKKVSLHQKLWHTTKCRSLTTDSLSLEKFSNC